MIFYFSATGNSQYAAEKIAAATGDKLISIGIALRDKHFDFDIGSDEYLGFVIPTFAWTLPGAVAEFIAKLKLSGVTNQYVYGVFTCGASSGQQSAALNTLLKKKGIPYSGSFDLVMPDNFILWSDVPSSQSLQRSLTSADKSLDRIIMAITSKAPGTVGAGVPKDLFMPMSEISTEAGTSKFYATDDCTGCGMCSTLCPMSCITQDDEGRPAWEGTCTMCLACLHRCPVKAVQHGNETVRKGRYVNPNTKPRFINKY